MNFERLSRAGDFFLAGPDSANDRHGCLVAILAPDPEGHLPTLDQLAALVAARLHLVPRRFRRVLVRTPLRLAPPLLVDDWKGGGLPRIRLLAGAGESDEAFRQALLAYARAPLDFSRPLWELALTPPLATGRAALIIKLHHAIVEGEGALASLGALLFSRAPTWETGRSAPWVAEPAPDAWRGLGLAARDQACRAGAVALRAGRVALDWRNPRVQWRKLQQMRAAYQAQLRRPRPPSLFSRAVGSSFDHQVAVCETSAVSRICERSPGDVGSDDVVLAAVAGGLRRWLPAIGEPLADIVVQMPVNLTNRGLAPSRDFTEMPSLMVVELPVREADPRERLRRIAAMTAERRGQARHLQAIAAPLAQLPMPLYRRAAAWIYTRAFDFHVASLRGPVAAPYVLTSRLELAYIMTPVRGRFPLRMAVLSLGGKLTIAFGCDPEIIREPRLLAEGIETAFDELADCVG